MKILLLSILLISTGFSKTLNLEWNDNPVEEQVTQYMIFVSDTTPIDLGNQMYNYDSTKTVNTTSTTVEVSDTQVTHITIRAYNVKGWGSVAMEIKHTPNRVMRISEMLTGPNPVTGVNSLKISIDDDAGRYILMEASDNLVVWEEYAKFIVGFYDIWVEYVPIDRPRRFFRYSYVKSAANLALVESPQLPTYVDPTPNKPVQRIPLRKNKHEIIHRSPWHFGRKR